MIVRMKKATVITRREEKQDCLRKIQRAVLCRRRDGCLPAAESHLGRCQTAVFTAEYKCCAVYRNALP